MTKPYENPAATAMRISVHPAIMAARRKEISKVPFVITLEFIALRNSGERRSVLRYKDSLLRIVLH